MNGTGECGGQAADLVEELRDADVAESPWTELEASASVGVKKVLTKTDGSGGGKRSLDKIACLSSRANDACLASRRVTCPAWGSCAKASSAVARSRSSCRKLGSRWSIAGGEIVILNRVILSSSPWRFPRRRTSCSEPVGSEPLAPEQQAIGTFLLNLDVINLNLLLDTRRETG